MTLTLRSAAEGTYNVYDGASLAGVILDHPTQLNRSVVYSADLAEIWADLWSGNTDDAMEVIRRKVQESNGEYDAWLRSFERY